MRIIKKLFSRGRYIYHVSYFFNSDAGHGNGDCEYFTDKPIKSYDGIQKIKDILKSKNNFKDVTILNFKLLGMECDK